MGIKFFSSFILFVREKKREKGKEEENEKQKKLNLFYKMNPIEDYPANYFCCCEPNLRNKWIQTCGYGNCRAILRPLVCMNCFIDNQKTDFQINGTSVCHMHYKMAKKLVDEYLSIKMIKEEEENLLTRINNEFYFSDSDD